jgi:hypothetical protein
MQYTSIRQQFDDENEPMQEELDDDDLPDAHEFDNNLTGTLIAPFQMSRKPCSDLLFLILFGVFMFGLFAIGFTSMRRGQPLKLLHPTDYLGRTCGNPWSTIESLPADSDCKRDGRSNECRTKVEKANELNGNEDLSQRPYLWFMDITNPLKYGGVCVSYCPGRQPGQEEKVDGEPVEGDIAEQGTLAPHSSWSYCPPQLQSSSNASTLCWTKRIDDGSQYPSLVTQQLLQYAKLEYRTVLRRCIPITQSKQSTKNITEIADVKSSSIFARLNSFNEVWTELWGDVLKSWKVVLLAIVVVAVLLSVLFLVLVRIVAHFFVWFSVVSVFFTILLMGAIGVLEGFEIVRFHLEYLLIYYRIILVMD